MSYVYLRINTSAGTNILLILIISGFIHFVNRLEPESGHGNSE